MMGINQEINCGITLELIDKKTGETRWVSKDAVGHYNTPIFNYLSNGSPAVILIGRGGAHGVHRKSPFGMSLISLKKGDLGKALWTWEPKK